LPLSLLTAAQNKPMLVELKNGETFNGHLVNCDNFMNITLREVYQTSADGDRFWKLKECYIRGSTIKYLRVPDTLLDTVKEEQTRAREAGRSARGGGGPGMRGGASDLISLQFRVRHTDHSFALCLLSSHPHAVFTGYRYAACNFHTGRGAPPRGGLSISFPPCHISINSLCSGRGGPRGSGQRGRGRGRGG
ncbi:hypothetical protein DEU56DRAFT_727061, partial [Suillus clintonianus]|uniref:uncharacterized protein n=1 Tax=Suillus clintonianus TaxID=1904413 RepID=UPI001B883D0B